MQEGIAPGESTENRITAAFFTKRVLALWLFFLIAYWFSRSVLFNDLLANQRLVVFSSIESQRIPAIAMDLILGNMAILLFFFPDNKIIVLGNMLLTGLLLFLMAAGGKGTYAHPMAFWVLPAFLFPEKTFFLAWKITRWIAVAGTLLYAWLLVTEPGTLELAYLQEYHRPSLVYAVFFLFVLAFFTPSFNRIFLLILLGFALFHSLVYHHPFWPKTLIFAPFLNWGNLHRFFINRFEPR